MTVLRQVRRFAAGHAFTHRIFNVSQTYAFKNSVIEWIRPDGGHLWIHSTHTLSCIAEETFCTHDFLPGVAECLIFSGFAFQIFFTSFLGLPVCWSPWYSSFRNVGIKRHVFLQLLDSCKNLCLFSLYHIFMKWYHRNIIQPLIYSDSMTIMNFQKRFER